MSNITQDGRIEMECDSSYDNFMEIFKFLIQLAYLIPGSILHLSIVRAILWKFKSVYQTNSFFLIYTLDSGASLIITLTDIFFNRLTVYIPPLCPILTPYFFEPSIFIKIMLITPNYFRAMKSITQIMMSINRMTCVIFPFSYITIWKKYLKLSIIITLLSPFLVIWNLFLSRVYISPAFGGFSYDYLKYVKWASLSKFHLVFISLAIIITIISTVVTMTFLIMLPTRVKSAEKSLCFSNITISVAFLIVGGFQSFFAFFPEMYTDTIYSLQFLSYDFLNISSPIVLVLMNLQLREHIFKKNGEGGGNSAFQVSKITVG
ncbi:unnamed protein product [Caenorhabditis angaria]|uniref:Serpentine receptor class gamma n=1 Tax=Caenorhabditis angaria TaxID=860376 RepID=A0A9P1IED2_9PELO|nr:unnamed protein product [Caenorhabditis angaria]